nr:hypothetical protein GCM10020092_056370 [Actinoplanes digitatis]
MALADETLTGYGSHVADARGITVTSTTGQQIRITAYGGHILRVRAVRGGEAFFADSRYEMVDPASHAGLGGTLQVVDGGDAFTITTGPTDGIRAVLRKNPLRLELYGRDDGAVLAREDATHSMSWGAATVRQTFAPAAPGEHFFKAGHGLYGRAPKVDRTGDVVSHNYGLLTQHSEQAPAIVPMFLSSQGYAIFFNTTFDTTFNFGNGGTYEFLADAHDASGARPQLDYFVIKGPEFAKLLDRYTQLTGSATPAAAWRVRPPAVGQELPHRQRSELVDLADHRAARRGIPARRPGARQPLAGWLRRLERVVVRVQPGALARPGRVQTLGRRARRAHHAGLQPQQLQRDGRLGRRPSPGYSFRPADLTGVADSDAVPDWSNPATRAWVWNVFWTKALDPALGFPGDALWIDEPDELGPIPYDALAADGRRWAELRNAYFLYCQKAARPGGLGRAHRPGPAALDLHPGRDGGPAALRPPVDRRHRLDVSGDAAADPGHAQRRAGRVPVRQHRRRRLPRRDRL